MKNIIQFLIVGSLTLSLLTGCSNILFDDDLKSCDKELPVSIVASISTNDNFQNKSEKAVTRADGTVTNDNDGTWTPQTEAMTENERTIAHIFLYAYKSGATNPEKVILYYPGSANPLGSTTVDGLEARPFTLGTDGTTISMELELYSGFYNFVLIVNSEAALTKAKAGTIPNPADLTEDNAVLTSDNLTGSDRKYLPMVGQNELFVPNYVTGSDIDRVNLIPAIDLESVHARVEFILTTANEAGTEYLSPILPLSEVKSLTLLNEQKKYTVMPSADDYTVTGKGLTNPIRATALTASTLMTGRPSFHKGTEISDSNKKIDKFKGRLLPYDINNETVKKYIYVAPSTLANNVNECLTLVFKVQFANDGEDTVYKIPLTNVGTGLTDKEKFVTRRNTIYRLNAKLIGRDLTVLDYEVINWTNQDVDIPW